MQTDAAHDAFMAFLYYSPYPYATTTNVHGFFVTPLGNYPHGERLAQQVADGRTSWSYSRASRLRRGSEEGDGPWVG